MRTSTFCSIVSLSGALWAGLASAASENKSAAADVAHNAGITYLTSGRPDLAVEQFKQAIEADSKNYHAYKGLGIAYAALRKFKEAEKAQRKCLELNADFADARNDLGAAIYASPAVAGSRLILRTETDLVCISQQ